MGMHLGLSPQECVADYTRLMSDDAIEATFMLQRYSIATGPKVQSRRITQVTSQSSHGKPPQPSPTGDQGTTCATAHASVTAAVMCHTCSVEPTGSDSVRATARAIATRPMLVISTQSARPPEWRQLWVTKMPPFSSIADAMPTHPPRQPCVPMSCICSSLQSSEVIRMASEHVGSRPGVLHRSCTPL